MQQARILVVEDGRSEREALVRVLHAEHYEVLAAENPEQAAGFFSQSVDLVISDLRMGPQSGIDLLRAWQQHDSTVLFIIMTAYGDVDSAVTAMKLGAVDFLTKPVNPAQVLALVHKCLEHRGSPAPDEVPAMAGPVLEEVKRAAMLRALEQFHGNRTRTAEYLGISVRTLQRKLKEWGLPEGHA
ncbi:MAG TPA: response regulator [Pirellulales bacterium]